MEEGCNVESPRQTSRRQIQIFGRRFDRLLVNIFYRGLLSHTGAKPLRGVRNHTVPGAEVLYFSIIPPSPVESLLIYGVLVRDRSLSFAYTQPQPRRVLTTGARGVTRSSWEKLGRYGETLYPEQVQRYYYCR